MKHKLCDRCWRVFLESRRPP